MTRPIDAERASANPRVPVVLDAGTIDLEYREIDGPRERRASSSCTKASGSVSMWRDFPDRLCAAGGYRGLVYSRPGYGTSTPRPHEVRWASDFMHRQARVVLPALLDALDIVDPPWLFGHSDGGSIALIHAASFPSRVAGVVVLAPHLDVEQGGVDSIALTREAYLTTDLREKLARHHADVDSAFWGWNDVWLSDDFRRFDIRALLGHIACPVLAIQGHDDQYGSMAHIDGIADVVPDTVLLKLDDCGHSPHRDRTDDVIEATVHFVAARAGHTSLSGAGAAAQASLRRLHETN